MTNWLVELFTGTSVAHTILVYCIIIVLGTALGKIRLKGISLGATFVLFVGLLLGHIGVHLDTSITDFLKNFGLILFVFSIGLQVGPGFFASFKKGGLTLNALAFGIFALGVCLFFLLYGLLKERIGMPMLVGIMCGAITSTPALGAAEEALGQLKAGGVIQDIPHISLGYAVAYPMAIIGSILVMMLLKAIFRIDIAQEEQTLQNQHDQSEQPDILTFRITNSEMDGMTLATLKTKFGHQLVATRVFNGSEVFIPHADTIFHLSDIVLVVAHHAFKEDLCALFGEETEFEWKDYESTMVSRRIVVTRSNINGKTIGQLHLRSAFNVNVTRINRAGVDLLARPDLVLQVGDKVMVVGPSAGIQKVETLLGNTLKRLNEPHIITIFLGILLGIILGAAPVYFPAMPTPAKLGLVGGPLVVAILLGRFGYKLKLITYTTQSANLMLRELGLSLFLASVGLSAGSEFVDSVISHDGLLWLLCGTLITMIPPFLIGIAARLLKLNFFTICGLIAGAHTNAPPLAYTAALSDTDEPAVSYSTVYPLITFLRILSAQMIVLFFT
ncbi:MAG: putative transporter [Paludibacter sp.]|nr:putative transporter [Bacteroidales bacterium]MCM1069473.1 putative transporter [Prevotella sp.]MCM1354129.1 putative transporter [Bacteroides sp.]MCM1443014.1 putative transporter [Muribaculum sp.]MCM1482204.1 putative transporter [Paludibacter sp.]